MFSAHNFSISGHFVLRFENILQDKFFYLTEVFWGGKQKVRGKGPDNARVAENEFFLIQKEYI